MKAFRFIFTLIAIVSFGTPMLNAQWVQTSPPWGPISDLAVSGTYLFAGSVGGGVFRTGNNGTSWNTVNAGLTNTYVYTLAVSGTKLFAGTQGGGVFLSTNIGTSWTAVNAGLTSTNIQALALLGANLFAGTPGGVFLSTNNGISWTEVNTGLASNSVRSFAVSSTNLFAGTYGGVFLSTDNGTTWSAVNTGLTNTSVYALAVSDANLFAGTDGGGGVFLSTNNGTSWTAANTPFSNFWQMVQVGTHLFAGTSDSGVFLSTDNGANWVAVNTGLESIEVYALAALGTDLFAGSDVRVWRRPLSEITSVRLSSHKLPLHFELAQNYPNPFNPASTIRFSVPHSSRVSLSVYTVLGMEVARLVNEQLAPGMYEATFDGSGLASGVYFYRLQSEGFVQTRKLVLQK